MSINKTSIALFVAGICLMINPTLIITIPAAFMLSGLIMRVR